MTSSVFDWRKPEVPLEQRIAEQKRKDARAKYNAKASQLSKRLTRVSQIPMQEKFNKVTKL